MEKQRRYDALRALLNGAGCAAAVVVGTPHIGGKRYFRYFTDWPIQSIGGYLVVWPAGARAIFRASSQAFWAGHVGWIDDIVAVSNPAQKAIDSVKELAGAPRVGIIG